MLYVAYLTNEDEARVERWNMTLNLTRGTYDYRWYDPETGHWSDRYLIEVEYGMQLEIPHSSIDLVLVFESQR